jgi:hypothetical protein
MTALVSERTNYSENAKEFPDGGGTRLIPGFGELSPDAKEFHASSVSS